MASPSARRTRSRNLPLPAVDERLVMPETRYEVIDGKVVYVPPSDIPHGSRHSKTSALLEAYAARGYDVVSDVLTRTSATGDMAPDVSVMPVGVDPKTGGRRLEELAFEVVSTERLSAAGRKASALSGRGVRRVFAIDVKRKRVLEWHSETDGWRLLSTDENIRDKALALPLPIAALAHAANADDAVANALLAKETPVLVAALEQREAQGEARGEARGKIHGRAQALLAVLEARGFRISLADRERVLGATDEKQIDRWLRRAVKATSLDGVFRK